VEDKLEGSWIYARSKKIVDTKSPESRNRRRTYRINWGRSRRYIVQDPQETEQEIYKRI
jgi:hypothetical protein